MLVRVVGYRLELVMPFFIAQKISPEGKAKVQLQVVLHNGVSSTFHFSNRNGLQAQLADRDKVKELLQTLLPKFKRKVRVLNSQENFILAMKRN